MNIVIYVYKNKVIESRKSLLPKSLKVIEKSLISR